MRTSLIAAALVLSLCACDFEPLDPKIPRSEPRAVASATVSIAAREAPSAPGDLPDLVASALASGGEPRAWVGGAALRRAVSEEVGSEIAEEDFVVEQQRGALVLTAHGDGRESAMARCAAWLRVLDRRLVEPDQVEALAWLHAERDRLLAELRGIRSALADLPEADARPWPRSIAEALTLARARKLSNEAAGRGAPHPTAMLAALHRGRAAAEAEVLAARARGAGDKHPSVLEASARRGVYEQRLAAQVALEREEAAFTIAFLEKSEKARADAKRAPYEALSAWLEHLIAEKRGGAASSDPQELRLLALEDAATEAELAAMATRYGQKHPARIAAEARRDRLRAEMEVAREGVKIQLRLALRSGEVGSLALEHDTRVRDARDRSAELARTLERIAAWEVIVASARAPLRVVAPCAARR